MQKYFKKILVIAIFILMIGAFTSCKKEKPVKYTVSLYNGTTLYYQTTVEKGRRIEVTIVDPTTTEEGARFTGWYKNEDGTNKWNFDRDIVTEDLSLYAGWLKVSENPTNVKGLEAGLKTGLTWMQAGVTEETTVKVEVYPLISTTMVDEVLVENYATEGKNVNGQITIEEENITWEPTEEVKGGKYKVKLTVGEEEAVEVPGIWFKGKGTTDNPHVIVNQADLDVITKTPGIVGADKYYLIGTDFSYETDYTTTKDTSFAGNLDGNGMIITISGNSGIFYNLTSSAKVENLTLEGNISTASWPGIGAIANNNEGKITNCLSYANVTSQVDIVARPTEASLGGAGGLVGINKNTGIIEKSSFSGDSNKGSSAGVVKATNGGGGITGTNYGTITECVNTGCLGAYNAVESGKSLSTYSYNGGIAGYNYGTIEKSGTKSIGKLLAQRALSESAASEYNNIAIGGVVGYNAKDAKIDQCYFEGIRVHGDQAVGGIAGINGGIITACYASGKYYSSTTIRSYVGGRLEVGGIAGRIEATSVIENCYSTVNVFAYQTTAYSIAEKANNTVAHKVNNDTNTVDAESRDSRPLSNTLVAPIGENNITIENTPITEPEVNAKLAETYLTTLGEKFAYSANEETIRLKFEIDVLGSSYLVSFYNQETLISTLTIYENGTDVINAPNYNLDNYIFKGWSLSVGGEVIILAGSELTYSQVGEYITSGTELTLYAILEEGEIIIEPTKELVIAYLTELGISEELTTALKEGFLTYCINNNIDIETITLKAVGGSKIAAYTEIIKNDPTIDIVLGVGNNIDTNSSSLIKDNVSEKIAMNIETNAGRYAISLTTGPNQINAGKFLEFIVTEEANQILNPPITEERTKNLVVGIFDRYCDSSIAENLKVAFEAYLESLGYTDITVTFITLTSRSVADVVAEVINSETKIDIVLGGGANINTTAASGITPEQTLSGTKTDVTIAGSNRNALTLTDSENLVNARTFIEFLALPETATILNPTA